MTSLRMYAQRERPSALVITAAGLCIIDALLRENGRVMWYFLATETDETLIPFLYADTPDCPMAYDPVTDAWDEAAAYALVAMWARERKG